MGITHILVHHSDGLSRTKTHARFVPLFSQLVERVLLYVRQRPPHRLHLDEQAVVPAAWLKNHEVGCAAMVAKPRQQLLPLA